MESGAFGAAHMLRPHADSDGAAYDVLDSGYVHGDLHLPRGLHLTSVAEQLVHRAVRSQLNELRRAGRKLSPLLQASEQRLFHGTVPERASEESCRRDRVLYREIDADSGHWRHGMRGIADA